MIANKTLEVGNLVNGGLPVDIAYSWEVIGPNSSILSGVDGSVAVFEYDTETGFEAIATVVDKNTDCSASKSFSCDPSPVDCVGLSVRIVAQGAGALVSITVGNSSIQNYNIGAAQINTNNYPLPWTVGQVIPINYPFSFLGQENILLVTNQGTITIEIVRLADGTFSHEITGCNGRTKQNTNC